MKCNIIRDLLPLYCDRLTSAESNEEIENHLRECAECAEIYENMAEEGITMTEQDKNIKPLKKVKKYFLIRLICGILGTAVVLFVIFMFTFWGVVPISSDKLSWTFEENSMTVFSGGVDDNGNFTENERYNIKFIDILFTGECSCTRDSYDVEHIENNDGTITSHHHITIYPVIKIPFDDKGEYPNQSSWGFSHYNDNDTITIHCRDKNITLYLKDIVEESGISLE